MSGCYITAACVIGMGHAEDCYELSLLRLFRREYVEKLPGGPAVLARHGELAPRIVAAVEALGPDASRAVWRELYRAGVAPAVRLIKGGHWDEAYDLYRSKREDLEARFAAPAKYREDLP